MYTISIAHERLVTTHAVADAVIDYTVALHRAGSADIIRIPVVLDGERPVTARLLISIGDSLIALPSSGAEIHLPDAAAATQELRRRLARLEPVVLHADSTDLPIELAFPDFDTWR